ncbi:hypothetical protein C2G38_2048001 [Gigaspora rosea]|uniref:SAP domain-containing protein n=1 Tax=Gigaspora rosea TaxID=44941 RepID=A0A397U789_9GLOM|nr:hypothetical protein C2G38_2048001 [Gigaspora rosea]
MVNGYLRGGEWKFVRPLLFLLLAQHKSSLVVNHMVIKSMAQIESDSDLQEILSTALPSSSNSGEDSEKISQQALRISMGRLSLETLKMLCKAEGLSELGTKKELVERLSGRIVNKAKGKDKEEVSNQSKNTREGRIGIDFDGGVCEGFFDKRLETSEGGMGARGFSTPDLQYIALERSLEKTVQTTMEKVVYDIKKSVQTTRNIYLIKVISVRPLKAF